MKEFYKVCRNVSVSEEESQKDLLCISISFWRYSRCRIFEFFRQIYVVFYL